MILVKYNNTHLIKLDYDRLERVLESILATCNIYISSKQYFKSYSRNPHFKFH